MLLLLSQQEGTCPLSEIRATTISDETGNGPIALTKQHAAKAWGYNIHNSTDSSSNTFNISSIADVATGRTDVTLTNAMSTQESPTVDGGTSNYPYQTVTQSASVFRVMKVNSSGNFADGASNAVQFGDLA